MRRGRAAPESIAEALWDEIRTGALPVGAALRQEELAERFAVSRMPVREALRLLERDGLVDVEPNRGARVVELDADEIVEATELRALVEGDLVARAVPRMDAGDREVIAETLVASSAVAASVRWSEGDWAFHECLYRPAARPRQLALVRSLRRVTERCWALHAELPLARERWLADHERIARACTDGDAERAATLVRDHVEGAGRFLVGRLRARGGAT